MCEAECQRIHLFWRREVDALVLGETTWETVGQRGFDGPQVFGSYLNTPRWNCITRFYPAQVKLPRTRKRWIEASGSMQPAYKSEGFVNSPKARPCRALP